MTEGNFFIYVFVAIVFSFIILMLLFGNELFNDKQIVNLQENWQCLEWKNETVLKSCFYRPTRTAISVRDACINTTSPYVRLNNADEYSILHGLPVKNSELCTREGLNCREEIHEVNEKTYIRECVDAYGKIPECIKTTIYKKITVCEKERTT